MSEELFHIVYEEFKYLRPRHAGDRLAQRELANPTKSSRRGYRKSSVRIFEYPQIVEAITLEADLVLESCG